MSAPIAPTQDASISVVPTEATVVVQAGALAAPADTVETRVLAMAGSSKTTLYKQYGTNLKETKFKFRAGNHVERYYAVLRGALLLPSPYRFNFELRCVLSFSMWIYTLFMFFGFIVTEEKYKTMSVVWAAWIFLCSYTHSYVYHNPVMIDLCPML